MSVASENPLPAARRGLVIDKAFMAIGILLLLGAVVVVAAWSIPAIREVKAVQSWISAGAEVVHSELKVETSHSDGRTTRSYTPIVRYLYTVPRGEGAVELLGSRVDIAGMRTESDSRDVVSRHTVGRRCTILHDPDEPWRSVLRPQGTPWGAWFAPGVMAVLGAMFVVLPGFALRKKASLQRPNIEIDRIGMRNFGGCLMIVGAIFVAVPMLFAVVWTVIAGMQAAERAATAAWIPVEATIEESVFERVPGGAVPRVRYRWTRDGITHTSTTLTAASVTVENAAGWSRTIHESVPGQTVTIRVDPDDPASAVLVAGDPTREWTFFAAGLGVAVLLAFFGGAVILQGRRFRRQAS